jgi:hypothetical protein
VKFGGKELAIGTVIGDTVRGIDATSLLPLSE